jgi:hypothetical protein
MTPFVEHKSRKINQKLTIVGSSNRRQTAGQLLKSAGTSVEISREAAAGFGLTGIGFFVRMFGLTVYGLLKW